MANTTARVPRFTVPFSEEKLEWGLTNTAATFYTNAAVGLKSDGYGTKYDDAAALKLLGVVFDSVPVVVDSDDAAGDKTVQAHRPKYLECLINDTTATTDVGKPVFAKFDNEVSYHPGTYKNYIGKVVKRIDATHVLVAPAYERGPDLMVAQLRYEAGSADNVFFVADRAYTVVDIRGRVEVAGTDAGAVTCVVAKAASGTAITSGTALHTGTFNLKGTAATNQALTLSATLATINLAAGTCLGIDFTGTLTSAAGTISVLLVPHG